MKKIVLQSTMSKKYKTVDLNLEMFQTIFQNEIKDLAHYMSHKYPSREAIIWKSLNIDEKSIGCYWIEHEDNHFYLGMFIRENERGRGYGKITLQEIIDQAIELNLKELYLNVRETNLHAISLYESFGFKVISSYKNKLNIQCFRYLKQL